VLEDAIALQQAGVFSLVLEAVPSEIARIITKELTIPTIGIGAGPHCSGQVLVQLDMLAAYSAFTPKYLLFGNELT
jgi:3-methyl-2-oxobutanoate hydroxymethyltransferase